MEGIKLDVDDYRPEREGWHLARTVTEAIRILATMPVDEASIDHDITHFDPTRPEGLQYIECRETFEPVVRYIAAMPAEHRPRKVTIHTGNVAKSEAMAALLNGTGIEVEIDYANRKGRGLD